MRATVHLRGRDQPLPNGQAESAAHLDTPDETGIGVEHNDVLWSQLFQHSIVFIASKRSNDDQIVGCTEAEKFVVGTLVKGIWHRVGIDDMLSILGVRGSSLDAVQRSSPRLILSQRERTHRSATSPASVSSAFAVMPSSAVVLLGCTTRPAAPPLTLLRFVEG